MRAATAEGRKPTSVSCIFPQAFSLKALVSLGRKAGEEVETKSWLRREVGIGPQAAKWLGPEDHKSQRRATAEKGTQRCICHFPLRHLPTLKLHVSRGKKHTKNRSWGAIEISRNFISPMVLGDKVLLQFKPSQTEDSSRHSRFSVETLNIHSQVRALP